MVIFYIIYITTLFIHYQSATTRVAAEDCVIGRQRIPKGLIIQAHMAAIHRDPDLWGPEDPDDFLPERYRRMVDDLLKQWSFFNLHLSWPLEGVKIFIRFLISFLIIIFIINPYHDYQSIHLVLSMLHSIILITICIVLTHRLSLPSSFLY